METPPLPPKKKKMVGPSCTLIHVLNISVLVKPNLRGFLFLMNCNQNFVKKETISTREILGDFNEL